MAEKHSTGFNCPTCHEAIGTDGAYFVSYCSHDVLLIGSEAVIASSNQNLKSEIVATQELKLTKAPYRAAVHCSACDSGLYVQAGALGLCSCPACDAPLTLPGNGEVAMATNGADWIRASQGDGLTPMERRVGREIGLTPEETIAGR